VDIKALLVPFDEPSNSRFTFRLFPFADEKQGNALTQPSHYQTLKGSPFPALFNNGSSENFKTFRVDRSR
jgi:hypothetical protein